jgi:hypothetical protein
MAMPMTHMRRFELGVIRRYSGGMQQVPRCGDALQHGRGFILCCSSSAAQAFHLCLIHLAH